MKVKTLITKNIILFFLLTVMVNFTKQEIIGSLEHPLFKNLTGSTFDDEVKSGSSWFIVFYTATCPYCKQALKLITKYLDGDDRNTEMNFGKVECDEYNTFICYRFNITRIPYIIILENNRMYELNSFKNENSLIDFINSEKEVDGGVEIPPSLGWFFLIKRSFEEASEYSHEIFSNLIKDTLKLNIEWTYYHSLGVMITCILITILFEIYLVLGCLNMFTGKYKKKDNKVDTTERQKDSSNGKVIKNETLNNKEKNE